MVVSHLHAKALGCLWVSYCNSSEITKKFAVVADLNNFLYSVLYPNTRNCWGRHPVTALKCEFCHLQNAWLPWGNLSLLGLLFSLTTLTKELTIEIFLAMNYALRKQIWCSYMVSWLPILNAHLLGWRDAGTHSDKPVFMGKEHQARLVSHRQAAECFKHHLFWKNPFLCYRIATLMP